MRPVKRNKMVASGRLTDLNFSDLYVSPILVKRGSTADKFQYVYLVAEIISSHAEVKFDIARLVPMANTKNRVLLILRFKIAAILAENLDRNCMDLIYPFGIIC